jgi:nucleoside-diphosphate-sugar epimerase
MTARPPGLAALTGGTGFIGRAVARRMTAAGWRLRLLTRSPPLHPQLADIAFEAVPGDLGDARSLERLVESVDVLVHCAGITKARAGASYGEVNAGGAGRLGQAVAAKAPHARVVAVSSMAAREPHLSSYAHSKAAGEEELRRALPPTTQLVVMRPAAVYGPWDRDTLEIFRLVGAGIAPLLNAAEASVSLVHIDDVADAIVAACDDAVPGGTYEVADEREGYCWTELMDALQAAVGVPRPARMRVPRLALLALAGMAELTTRIRPTALSFGKVREILHPDWSCHPEQRLARETWHARISLDVGLADSAAWYQRAGWLKKAVRSDLTTE